MAENELPYFKFVSALIDTGIWAEMSPAARTLYPVLLRFSDRNFKPVFPGSQTLLKLTGFKQKSSLRRARNELIHLGLISVTEGTGRKNSCYHFRFDDWPDRSPPWGAKPASPGGRVRDSQGGFLEPARGATGDPGYNQIHISINNHVPTPQGAEPSDGENRRKKDFLTRRFGQHNVELAVSECKISGIVPTAEHLEEILYSGERNQSVTWNELEKYLTDKISPGSFGMIREAFREEKDGWLFFSAGLPMHLQNIVKQVHRNVFFEPALTETLSIKRPF